MPYIYDVELERLAIDLDKADDSDTAHLLRMIAALRRHDSRYPEQKRVALLAASVEDLIKHLMPKKDADGP